MIRKKKDDILFKRGGIREFIPIGIQYLTMVVNNSLGQCPPPKGATLAREDTFIKAKEELEKLIKFKYENRLKLKKLGVLEDKGKISLVFEGDTDGVYFLFAPFGFLKIEDLEYIQKVSTILKSKKYVILENNIPKVMEV